MRNKLLFALVAIILLACGTGASATPYAVYCEGDLSLHLLNSDTELAVGETLASNSQEITKIWEIDLINPYESYYSPWSGATQATKVIIEESFQTVRPISCHAWFYNFSELTEIEGIEYLYTENVTDMSWMFYGCSTMTALNLSKFNTENVTDMTAMFQGCSTMTELDLSSFNTGNVTYMTQMFYGCSALTELNLSNFNTGKVTSMGSMFGNCSDLTELDLSNFNTEKVTSMGSMFYGCSALTELDLSNFNTGNVLGMSSMFYGCSALTKLDLSNFNTENVTSMKQMFYRCSALTELDLSSFNTGNVTGMDLMFQGCSALTKLDLSNFNTENVTIMSSMFYGCSALTELNLSNFNTGKVTSMGSMFGNCSDLTELDLSNFNTEKVTSMGSMFYRCSALTELDLSKFDTGNVTDMNAMFYGCSALTELDLSSFNTGKVTNMNQMFYGCSALTELDLSKFDTGNVTGMSAMFYGCSALTELDLSKFDLTKGKSTYNILNGCNNLRLLILSNSTIPNFSDFINSNIGVTALIFAPEGTVVTEGRANVVVGNTCENLVINYGSTTNNQLLLKIPYSFTADKVTINRSFTKDQPYTLYLPFAMNAADYGTFYTGGQYNEADGMVYFTRLTAERTTANTPYMFQPNQDFTDGITIEGPVSVTVTPEDTETDGLNGVYEMKEFTADETAQKIYYGWAGGDFCWAEAGAKVDACRAYFKLPASAAAKAPARLKVKLGEDGTTGITDIDREDGDTDSPAYNINGQRVTDGYRGVVIKNGRKTANFAR